MQENRLQVQAASRSRKLGRRIVTASFIVVCTWAGLEQKGKIATGWRFMLLKDNFEEFVGM